MSIARFEGVFRRSHVPDDFVRRVEERVASGFLLQGECTPSVDEGGAVASHKFEFNRKAARRKMVHMRAHRRRKFQNRPLLRVIDRLFRRLEERVVLREAAGKGDNYGVRLLGSDIVEVVAQDKNTQCNVGLNNVILRRVDDFSVSYRVRFARWTTYHFLDAVVGPVVFVFPVLYLAYTFVVARFFGDSTTNMGITGSGLLLYAIIYMLVSLLMALLATIKQKRRAQACLEGILHDICED